MPLFAEKNILKVSNFSHRKRFIYEMENDVSNRRLFTHMLSKSTVLFYILFPYYCYGDEVYCERFMEYFPLTTPFIIFFVLFSYYYCAHERYCQQYPESFDSLSYNRVLIGLLIKSLFSTVLTDASLNYL